LYVSSFNHYAGRLIHEILSAGECTLKNDMSQVGFLSFCPFFILALSPFFRTPPSLLLSHSSGVDDLFISGGGCATGRPSDLLLPSRDRVATYEEGKEVPKTRGKG
jgi:hypothetical protein